MIEELATRIWDKSAFQSEYQKLVQESLSQSVRVINQSSIPLDQNAIRRLLQSATHFAASPQLDHRAAAYRIAIAAFQRFGTEYDNIREIALLIFSRLGNFPAADYLYQGQMEMKGTRLPQSVWFEMTAHEATNSIRVNEQANVTLTDFQKRLWDVLNSGVSTALTAPTSAGKSFVLQRYLVSILLQREGWGLYIVPTRTLINQVSASLSKLIKELNGNHLAVSTIPAQPSELGKSSGVYVLTQERLQMLLGTEASIDFHLAIIDEAQMVAEGARGVILQSVVERLHLRIPTIQFLFGSPQTSNPRIFEQVFDLEGTEVIQEQESPVAQNLIFIDRVPRRTKEVTVSVQIGDQREILGPVALEHSLGNSDKALAHVSWIFGRSEKSLVYTGGQARCEKIANELVQLAQGDVPPEASPANPALVDFSEFLKEHIHPEYFLAESILYGIAVHYGNLPSIVRKTIEEYFDEGLLSFLVCTSTLLHGVNLPAKNLFLLNPTKGSKSTPISSLEFWNLAGRAGRLGKDFEGNIFLVDLEKWKLKPLEGEKYQEVKTALSNAIADHGEAFLEFVQNKEHPSGKLQDQNIENAFVKVFNDYRQGRLSQTLDKALGTEQPELRARVENAIQEIAAEITVPSNITERNITVSVFRQQAMLDYLLRRIEEEGPEPFIPLHPQQPNALPNLRRLFKRIHTHFEGIPGKDKSESFLAPLALRWMRGDSLRRLINENHQYQQTKQESPVPVNGVIRKVLKTIGNDFRFRYVKYTSCYNDLLGEALRQSSHEERIVSIPPIPLFLEIGASSQTMINLVGMGFSRTAASILAERAGSREMIMPELQQWLFRQNWETSSISQVVLREIRRILR
jgi:superfamily II DNA/RNA helicase